MPRPRSDKTGPAVNLRLGEATMKQLQTVSEKTGKPIADVIREAMAIGLANWEITGWDIPRLVAGHALQQERDIALIAEPKRRQS